MGKVKLGLWYRYRIVYSDIPLTSQIATFIIVRIQWKIFIVMISGGWRKEVKATGCQVEEVTSRKCRRLIFFCLQLMVICLLRLNESSAIWRRFCALSATSAAAMSGERIEAHSSLTICRVFVFIHPWCQGWPQHGLHYHIPLVPFNVVSSVVSMESFHVHSVTLFNHFVFGLSIFLLLVW